MEDEVFSVLVTFCVAIAVLISSQSPVSCCSHCITFKSGAALSKMPVLASSFYSGNLDERKEHMKNATKTL